MKQRESQRCRSGTLRRRLAGTWISIQQFCTVKSRCWKVGMQTARVRVWCHWKVVPITDANDPLLSGEGVQGDVILVLVVEGVLVAKVLPSVSVETRAWSQVLKVFYDLVINIRFGFIPEETKPSTIHSQWITKNQNLHWVEGHSQKKFNTIFVDLL